MDKKAYRKLYRHIDQISKMRLDDFDAIKLKKLLKDNEISLSRFYEEVSKYIGTDTFKQFLRPEGHPRHQYPNDYQLLMIVEAYNALVSEKDYISGNDLSDMFGTDTRFYEILYDDVNIQIGDTLNYVKDSFAAFSSYHLAKIITYFEFIRKTDFKTLNFAMCFGNLNQEQQKDIGHITRTVNLDFAMILQNIPSDETYIQLRNDELVEKQIRQYTVGLPNRPTSETELKEYLWNILQNKIISDIVKTPISEQMSLLRLLCVNMTLFAAMQSTDWDYAIAYMLLSEVKNLQKTVYRKTIELSDLCQ